MAQSGEGKPRVVISVYDAEAMLGGPGVAKAQLRSEVVQPMELEPSSLGVLSEIASTPFAGVLRGEVS